MASRFWVGGSGTWDATTTTHWATTSGGAGGASAPTSADDVFLDASSGAGTVTLAAGAVCKNLDCTGFAQTLSTPSGSTLDVYGTTFKLVAGMTWNLGTSSFVLTFRATAGTCLITTAGKSLATVTFDGVGGTWQLQDNVTTTTNRSLTLTNGVLDLNGKTLNLGGVFASSNSNVREMKAAGATINLNATGSVWSTTTSTNMTQTGFASLTVNVNNTTAASKALGHTGQKIGTVNVVADPASGNTAGIVSFNSFTAVALNVTGPKYVLMSTAAKNIDTLTLNGSTGNSIDLRSATSGTRAVVTQATRGTATYTVFTDIEVRGPTLFAGSSSTNGGNNAGISFNNARSGILVAS
jgi:hypothetical protein